jgi:hypothetical protein
MHGLAWIASTPAGARLGEAAVSGLQVVLVGSPWWSAPLEPIRWLTVISGTVPHTFVTLGLYGLLAIVAGLVTARRRGRPIGVATALVLLMGLAGGLFAFRTVDTWLPGGVVWRVPPGAPYRIANLHAHSQASGGSLMPEDLVAWHHAHGYQVLAISDSNGLRGVERAQAYIVHAGLDMILVPAEEYRGGTGGTHLLMFNIQTPILPSRYPVREAIGQARAQGGLVVVAHPWTSEHSPEELVSWGAAGFEVTNGGVEAGEATRALAGRLHLAETGDLDFRSGHRPLTATALPLWADSPARIQEALARGECAALYFPDEVDSGGFHFWPLLVRNVTTLARERTALFLGGIGFWTVAFLVLRRRRLPPCTLSDRARLGLVAVLCLAVGTLAVWSMWWQFRTRWYPRTEWAIYLWAVAAPLAAWLVTAPARRSGPGAPS